VVLSRRIGRPAWPARKTMVAETVRSATGRSPTARRRFDRIAGASRFAHAARSAGEAVPSPFVSMAGIA